MAKTKSDKPNVFIRIARKCKEVFAELKKVTWPTFGKVVKTTSIVLVVVAAFLIIATVANTGLQALLTLITELGA